MKPIARSVVSRDSRVLRCRHRAAAVGCSRGPRSGDNATHSGAVRAFKVESVVAGHLRDLLTNFVPGRGFSPGVDREILAQASLSGRVWIAARVPEIIRAMFGSPGFMRIRRA